MIQHDHICTPGFVGERFTDRGYDLAVHQVVSEGRFQSPDVETQFPEPTDFDVIISMGAPWSVYDHETIGSWVLPELAMLRRPTLITCRCSGFASGAAACGRTRRISLSVRGARARLGRDRVR